MSVITGKYLLRACVSSFDPWLIFLDWLAILLDESIPAINFEGGIVPKERARGEVVLSNVWFAYPKRTKVAEGIEGQMAAAAADMGSAMSDGKLTHGNGG
eukprot:COSAG05_NODE_8830_length_668_cov_0.926186_1_plen_99_part_10